MKSHFFTLLNTKVWLVVGVISLLLFAALCTGLINKPPYSEAAYKFFDDNFLRQANAYEAAKLKIYLGKQLGTWFFLLMAALFTWKYFALLSRPSLLAAAGYIVLLFFVYQLVSFPLEYYQGFLLEDRFGLSTQPLGSWLGDYGKGAAISLGITLIALTGLYLAMQAFPHSWWWLAGIVFSIFIVLSTYLFPLLVDPLFYNFNSLEDQKMQAHIIEMANRAGIEVEKVLVADASRKTHKVNAYFTGMGNTKRIVLYDTLLHRFPKAETLTVIAHEMGHWQYAHILKGVLLSSAAAFFAFFLCRCALKNISTAGDFRAIFLALLFFSLLSFCSLPVVNTVSRHFERQADRAALDLTGDLPAFIKLKQNLATANLAQVEPHPLVRAILYSHPSILERIEMALKTSE